MEQPMRQILLAVLITLTVVNLTEGRSLVHSPLEPADLSTDSQDIRLAKDSALSQSPVGKSLGMEQSPAQQKSGKNAKNQPDQPEKPKSKQTKMPTSDRTANYQCLEYCVVVRQSCEGLATVQPNVKISKIGSKENNIWSSECQKMHNSCMNKCDTDEKSINWKSFKEKEGENGKK
jgi:hypothetical protein